MKKLVVLLVFIPSLVSAEPCTQQDYSNVYKVPDWSCPSPGESILLPEIKFRPSIGMEEGSSYQTRAGVITLDYPAVLMDREKVLHLGLRIQGLRRLRWLDMHKSDDILEVERKYVGTVLRAKLDIERARYSACKTQKEMAQKKLNEAKKWYRSWTFGFVLGVVTTSATVAAVAVLL